MQTKIYDDSDFHAYIIKIAEFSVAIHQYNDLSRTIILRYFFYMNYFFYIIKLKNLFFDFVLK